MLPATLVKPIAAFTLAHGGHIMTTMHGGKGTNIARIVVGLIWIGGAVWNLVFTTRMDRPYGWLADDAGTSLYRWFFGEVVEAHPVFWTVLLAIGELTVGGLTLMRGGWAKLGLLGGALFSAFLFLTMTPYTLIMGPYAVFLGWLAAKEYPRNAWEIVRALFHRDTKGAKPHPA